MDASRIFAKSRRIDTGLPLFWNVNQIVSIHALWRCKTYVLYKFVKQMQREYARVKRESVPRAVKTAMLFGNTVKCFTSIM